MHVHQIDQVRRYIGELNDSIHTPSFMNMHRPFLDSSLAKTLGSPSWRSYLRTKSLHASGTRSIGLLYVLCMHGPTDMLSLSTGCPSM